jgi:hypothetical protein
MITDFAPLLEQHEIDVLVSKLRLMRQMQGLEASNDEVICLVAWGRSIRRSNALFNLFLMSGNDEMLVDVDILKQTVNIVKLV